MATYQAREREHYLTKKLGAFSDDLATVAHFFTPPWHTPAAGLGKLWQAGVLNWTGIRLRALGRLHEALEQMQASIKMSAKQEYWIDAAQNARNLSELQLTLGDVAAAMASSQQSVDYTDKSGDIFMRVVTHTTHADALHQAGETAQALELFIAAEKIEQERQPEYPRLYSLWGFRYCDLLLAQGKVEEVLERAEYSLELSMGEGDLLSIALDQLTLGRAYYQQGNFPQAINRLDQAVASLRMARQQDDLPRGLLARAALNHDTRNPNHDFTQARQDLQEVYDIAEPSGMRLYLADYHLELARLLLAERECGIQSPDEFDGRKALTLNEHVAAAARLIEETGYKRRLPELEALQSKIEM